MGSTSSSSGGETVVGFAVGVLEVLVGLGFGLVGVEEGDGACVVGAAVVGVVVADGDSDTVRLGERLGDGTGSGSEPRDAHRAPAPSPITIATTTAMMMGAFEGVGSGSGSCPPAGGMAVVG